MTFNSRCGIVIVKGGSAIKNFLDVYVSPMPTSEPQGTLVPSERDAEVKAVGSERVRREKHFVWRLLEEALRSSLSLTLDEAGLYKSESGKWLSRVCEISLSHSGELLAVAVSSLPVGIDIEGIIEPRAARFAERVLTPAELSHYESLQRGEREIYLTECWTKKEARFKMSGSSAFVPNAYESSGESSASRIIEHRGKSYVLAVASECIFELNYKQIV